MNDAQLMQQALELARKAQEKGEVPVGAIVVLDNKVIGIGHNQPIASNDPTAHAEIIAIRAAAQNINNYRLTNATLCVTLEPCAMCLGAIMHARIKRLVFAATDPKRNNNYGSLEITSGILATESSVLLKEFFVARR